MRLDSNPALPAQPDTAYAKDLNYKLQALFRNIANKVNSMADGRLSAIDNAATAIPTTGTWATGDILRNSNPSGTTPTWAWICTAGGTPGTWEALTTGGASAWTSAASTITANVGTITTKTGTIRYIKQGKTVMFSLIVKITTNGTGAGWINATLPFPAVAETIFSGAETNIGFATIGYVAAASSVMSINKYDASYPGGNGTQNMISGVYEST